MDVVNIQPVENGYVVSYHPPSAEPWRVFYPTLRQALLAVEAVMARANEPRLTVA